MTYQSTPSLERKLDNLVGVFEAYCAVQGLPPGHSVEDLLHGSSKLTGEQRLYLKSYLRLWDRTINNHDHLTSDAEG